MEILVCTDVFLHVHGTFILAQGGEDGSYTCHHQCATEYDRARRVRLFAGHFVEQTVEVGGMFLPLSVAQRDFRRRLLEEEVHLQYFLAESLVECDIIFLSFDGGRRTVFPSCSAGVDAETAVKSVFQRADKVGQLAGGAGQAECQARYFCADEFAVYLIVRGYRFMMVGGTEHIVVLAVILLDGAGDHVQFGSTDNESEVSVDFQPADNLVSGSAGGTAEVVIFRWFGHGSRGGCCRFRPFFDLLVGSFPFREFTVVGILFPFVFSFQIILDFSWEHVCQCEKSFTGGGGSNDQGVELRTVRTLVETDADLWQASAQVGDQS